MKTVMLMLTSLLMAGCSVLGKREAAEPPYELLKHDGAFEVRRYGPMVIAETILDEKSYSAASGKGFNRLAGYIFGKNRSKTSISMTAPVLQERSSEKISMTAPVLQQPQKGGWSMAFVLPEGFTLQSAPEPLDPEVKLRELPPSTIAVVTFSGLHSAANLEKYSRQLQAWLKKQGYRALSEPKLASYDPPWTIPFLRRNEVQIRIEPDHGESGKE
ncbi:MAG TPA: heme-binding protein [Chlorobaculum sp.]|uniref:Lipoprotein, putative n=1 Tax=Chlorobaculum tepidum (strain ATCC 49652 / DSM 12025 / NBRC 103806 / TLS) TaxID=194439 RepID=Q8KDD5_CHLTE|nr:heme-binding protein [Chlorobaculum tepidum]AAM72352.1 lipoprotein, putative [Chlorobaculum tepidum TLS]HBU22693.1 heme-binding protein [Chlorobaculum sp.]